MNNTDKVNAAKREMEMDGAPTDTLLSVAHQLARELDKVNLKLIESKRELAEAIRLFERTAASEYDTTRDMVWLRERDAFLVRAYQRNSK